MSALADAVHQVSLASMTTLEVGGPVPTLVSPMSHDEAVEAILEIAASDAPLHVIGGGSNVLVADSGLDGVALRSADYAIEVSREGRDVEIEVGAGVEWDEFVAFCCDQGFAGVECLSGIPGKVGAAPIQNIGAYGQEVASAIAMVRTIDRRDGSVEEVPPESCGFGYRTSRFKGEWRDRRFVSGVRFALRWGEPSEVAYPSLRDRLEVGVNGRLPPPVRVREAVMDIRRSKSMIYDAADPNHRSAGSFFVNPVVSGEQADAVADRAEFLGHDPASMPRFDVDGGVKLSAAWLIERSGFEKGFAFGAAGLSTRHCLALINRGGASARDLVALAAIVRRGVRTTFGVTLVPEPVFLGFEETIDELLG